MLPIRFASLALARRLFGLTLLLVLMAIGLGPMRAGPLAAVGVDDFRALIEPKHDPSPDPSEAGPVLSDYRRKIRKIAKELPSLGEVSRVLLLSEWTAPEIEPESPVALDQIKKVVQEPTDQAFQLGVQQLMAKSEDSIGISRAIVAEIKRDVRLKLIERLQKRISFYLLEGRTEDRIAAANLIRDTMSNSRRQDISTYRDPTSGAVVAGVMANKREDIRPSAQYLRQRMRELSGDLKKLTEHPNIQARAAGLMALSDLEDDPTFLVNIYKPLLTSPESDVRVRRATAEALSHTLEVAGVQMEKDRPEPYLRGLKVLLPVAVLGLTDSDTRVRRASLEACERAAVIFDELAGDPLSATDRRVVFRSALDVMDQILPKLNAAARDSVPEYRVAACKVLETLVLGMQKLQRFKNEPLPPPGIDPTVPPAPPSSDKERSKKKVSLPIQRSGRERMSAGPSQWAAARLNPARQ